jgi:hypothetical protein
MRRASNFHIYAILILYFVRKLVAPCSNVVIIKIVTCNSKHVTTAHIGERKGFLVICNCSVDLTSLQ